MTTFGSYVHTVIEQAGHHASRDGSAMIEASRPPPARRDLRPAHLLLGILESRVGTVPRALALAGIDRADLTARVRQALGDNGR